MGMDEVVLEILREEAIERVQELSVSNLMQNTGVNMLEALELLDIPLACIRKMTVYKKFIAEQQEDQ